MNLGRAEGTRTLEIRLTPLLTARRLPLDAEKHAFRAFAGDRISQKKIKARFESVVCSTAILGVGSTRLHPSSSGANLKPNPTPPCKTGCLAPAVAAITAKLQTTLQKGYAVAAGPLPPGEPWTRR